MANFDPLCPRRRRRGQSYWVLQLSAMMKSTIWFTIAANWSSTVLIKSRSHLACDKCVCVSWKWWKLSIHVYADIPDDIPVDFFFLLFFPYALAGCPSSHLKAADNIRALAAWVSQAPCNEDHLKMSGSLVSNSNRQRGNYAIFMFPLRPRCLRHNFDTVPPCFIMADRNITFLSCYEKLTKPY